MRLPTVQLAYLIKLYETDKPSYDRLCSQYAYNFNWTTQEFKDYVESMLK